MAIHDGNASVFFGNCHSSKIWHANAGDAGRFLFNRAIGVSL